MNLMADVVKAKILQDVKFGKDFTASDLAFYSNPNQQQKSAGKLAVKCFRCKKQGYYTSLCQKKPSEKKDERDRSSWWQSAALQHSSKTFLLEFSPRFLTNSFVSSRNSSGISSKSFSFRNPSENYLGRCST